MPFAVCATLVLPIVLAIGWFVTDSILDYRAARSATEKIAKDNN